MDNLILSFNIVSPLCLTMGLGYFLKYLKMFDENSLNIMNNVAFKIFLPLLLFYNVYNTNMGNIIDFKLMMFIFICILVLFGFLFFFIPIIEKYNSKRGVMIQGVFRSNFVLFGIPVATSILGEGNIGSIALLIGVVVPTYNLLAVICLETFRDGKINVANMIKGVITNPLIIAGVIGIIFFTLKIKLPTFIETTVKDISGIATPLSLILLGASFSFSDVKKYIKETSIVTISRLIIVPLIFVTLGYYVGYRHAYLLGIMIIFAAPTAVSSFQMAKQMDGDADLAGQIVVFTSAFSIVTVFFWIFTLKQFSLI